MNIEILTKITSDIKWNDSIIKNLKYVIEGYLIEDEKKNPERFIEWILEEIKKAR